MALAEICIICLSCMLGMLISAAALLIKKLNIVRFLPGEMHLSFAREKLALRPKLRCLSGERILENHLF